MKNNKGFTLVEILASIVIIGLLALITIPSVNTAMENSRKKKFISDIKSYINIFRSNIAANEYNCSFPQVGTYSYIRLDKISSESETKQSPWGGNYTYNEDIQYFTTTGGYIVIVNKKTNKTQPNDKIGKIEYYFVGSDSYQNGIFELTKEEKLNVNKIKNNSKEIKNYNEMKSSDLFRVGRYSLTIEKIVYAKDTTCKY